MMTAVHLGVCTKVREGQKLPKILIIIMIFTVSVRIKECGRMSEVRRNLACAHWQSMQPARPGSVI